MQEQAGRMYFEYQAGENEPLVQVTLSPHVDLSEAITQFEGFLKAAGYAFEGELDFVEDASVSDEVN